MVAHRALSLTGLVLRGVTNYFGNPLVWDSIGKILKRFRNEVFVGIDGDRQHHHRATLFKCCSCWIVTPWRSRFWPWGKGYGPLSSWMVAVARSSEDTRSTRTVFRVAGENDSEGIVGLVWQSGEMHVLELPPVSATPTEEELQAYAVASMMPIEWVRHRAKKKGHFPRQLCGIPIEVKNKRWGVLVLDSRRPNTINDKGRTWSANVKFAQLSLGELLRLV